MKNEKHWIFLAIIVVISIALTAYFGTAMSERAEITVSAYPQPAAIGHATIQVDSTVPLEQVFVVLPDRNATLSHTEGNSHFFSYFVSPYDDVGLKQINVYAIDVNGHKMSNTTQGLYVDYAAAGDRYSGIIFYSYDWSPAAKAVEIAYSPRLNFFFEARPYGDDGNSEVINSFVPLITHLASSGVNLSSYGVETDGTWLSCTDEAGTALGVEACEQLLKSPSIILRYPSYPTTQIQIGDSTIEIQPARGEVQKAIDATIELLEENTLFFDLNKPAVEVTLHNSTGNSTE